MNTPRFLFGLFLLGATTVSMSGCILIGRSATTDQELIVSTSERVRHVEQRLEVIELSQTPDGQRRISERLRRLESEVERLREENRILAQQLAEKPEE